MHTTINVKYCSSCFKKKIQETLKIRCDMEYGDFYTMKPHIGSSKNYPLLRGINIKSI